MIQCANCGFTIDIHKGYAEKKGKYLCQDCIIDALHRKAFEQQPTWKKALSILILIGLIALGVYVTFIS